MDGFTAATIETAEAGIFVRMHGSGPPVLLLHGFPETHLMWRGVAPLLARRHTVVCADLRGYGSSSCPASAPDHAPYAKRALARDMVAVMEQLGFVRFRGRRDTIRGGRVAYRMALDHPERVAQACGPRYPADREPQWDRADARLALGLLARGRCWPRPSRCRSGS
jgi:haloacetate dehalogenase